MSLKCDSRLFLGIQNWINTFGYLINEEKLVKLLSSSQFDKAVLGVYIERARLDLSLFNNVVLKKTEMLDIWKQPIREEYLDPLWLKYNIRTHGFTDQKEKYLKNIEHIKENVLEIKERL